MNRSTSLLLPAIFACILGPVHAGGPCDDPVWQDEFDASTLDSTKWRSEIGDGCDREVCGWGNNELQWYSPENLSVSEGILRIKAKKEAVTKGPQLTSAKITTQHLFAQRFGRFEARMKLPDQLGMWPAFWMMPEDKQLPWPIEGEIDILERGGREQDDLHRILGAAHLGEPWPDNVHYSESLLVPRRWGESFHTYRVDWQPGLIRWSVDDKIFGQVTADDVAPYHWPFNDKQFYLIINLAVGGTLGGDLPENFYKADLLVDYVRVYEYCDGHGNVDRYQAN